MERKNILIIVFVLVILIVALGASYMMFFNKGETTNFNAAFISGSFTGNVSGNVHWRFILSATKGHGQRAGIPTATTIDLIFPIPANSLGTHFVAEIPAPGWYTTELEWDTVIHCTVQRRADLATDTYNATVAAWQADLHYQVGRIATPARLPPFI